MSKDRHVRLTGILKELVATYIRSEANSDPMITVTSLDLSPDMRKAIIFVTTLPDGRENDAVIFLKRNATDMRNFLKKNARIKHIPHLEFMVDAGEKHRQHIDELSSKIKAERSQTESD